MNLDVDVILFDWGGTLARVATQAQAWHRGANAACAVLARHGFRNPDAVRLLFEVMHAEESRVATDPTYPEIDADDLFQVWALACGWAVPANGIRREAIDAFGACWIGCLEPCPGALDTVKELRERGYRMGLASNCWTPAAYAMPELERQGFARLLHGVTLSCDVGRRKPAQAFYEAALRAVGVSMRDGDLSRVLFVGDAPIFDVAAPAALGMKTALVRTPPGTWPAEHYERIAPAVRVDAITELLPHLPRR